MLKINEETGNLPGKRQDLQDAKQQSQAKILPLLKKEKKKSNNRSLDPILYSRENNQFLSWFTHPECSTESQNETRLVEKIQDTFENIFRNFVQSMT